MNKPKSKYAYGLDWKNWNIGFHLHRIKDFGNVLTITIFPLTFHIKVSETNER